MASGAGKAMGSSWAAAMSMGAGTVEALKDRQTGLCRWNRAFWSVQQRASSTAAAAAAGNSNTTKAASTAGGAAARRKARLQQEEELRTVMYLSNWGPNN